MKLRLLIAGCLLFGVAASAQTPAAQPTPVLPPANLPATHPAAAPPPAAPANSPANAAAAKPETKITPQQAEELFRSVDKILKFVSADTGLPIKHRVKRQLASRSQVEEFIGARLKDDEETARLEHSSVVLKKFGLIPRDFNLGEFMLALLREQVAGFYDAKTKSVYLLDWVEPDEQRPVLAHELTHALQDQNFGLDRLDKRTSKHDPSGMEADERLAALQAVVEGQAMIVSMDYLLAPQGSSVAKQPELVEAMQAGLSSNTPGNAVFDRAPVFLQQVLLFPYRYGALFERDVLVAKGKEAAFAGTLKQPPHGTRQVMLPSTYLNRQKVPLLSPVDFKKLAGGYPMWDVSLMGEFDVSLLLQQYATPEIANDLSQMWRGGYYWAGKTPAAPKDDRALTPSGLAVAYVSHWSSDIAALEFAGIYSDNVQRRYPGARQTAGLVAPKPELSSVDGVQVTVTPRLPGPIVWQTSEGEVSIETHDDTVLVMESFDPQTAKTIHDAVFR
jgi:hypothetical protein